MDNSRVGEGVPYSETSGWKSVWFRKKIVKEIAKAIVVNWPQAVKGSTSLIMGSAERIEENVFASAKDEADYKLKIRIWIRSLDTSSMVPRRKPSATSCNISEAASSSGSNERVADVDWQEVLYQKAQMLRSDLLPILSDIYRCFIFQLSVDDLFIPLFWTVYSNVVSILSLIDFLLHHSSPQNIKQTEIERLPKTKKALDEIFTCLNVTRSQIGPDFESKLDEKKRHIRSFVRVHRAFLDKKGPHSTDKCSTQKAVPSQSSVFQDKLSEKQLTVPSMSLQISHLPEQIPNENKMNPPVKSAKSKQDDPEKLMQQVAKEYDISLKHEIPLSTVTSEQPTPAFQRLVKVASSLAHKSLSESVREIRDIIYLSDILSAPFKRPKNVICSNSVVDLGASSQVGYSKFGDFLNRDMKLRRSHNAMPLYNASLYASTSESIYALIDTDTDSVSPQVKYPTNEEKKTLIEEIKEVKMLLFDTKVVFNEADIIPSVAAGASELIVELCFTGVTVSSNLMSHLVSNHMSIKPLQLRIPTNYPNCSPILLDEMPSESRDEPTDLSTKAKQKFQRSLRSLSDPLSFKSIAMTWEKCVKEALCDYAHKFGGGTFSSKYGGWKNV
ncbi:hypothetical protein QN277_002011 [Acacia crassicarpa]|uniref:ARC105/Med15 mediator subunit C-terminal domain-containing protein n=1 Tax=Acacia crassicarpa TaxID=499986 RepID=A0AAE1THM2_9FABA|nr:hypothetical protein QN277_002011 [Acacia crassicarpa]